MRSCWGFDQLRPMQAEAIESVIAGRDSLVVLPTGGGKSLCYQVPPLVTGKLTVVVSPLIALMKDQVDGLRLVNYPAAAIHSGVSPAEQTVIRQQLATGSLRLLLVSPERLLSDWFTQLIDQSARSGSLGAFAVDEAHCVSQWGHDFRPEYRRLAELRERWPDVSIHAYTATATPRVRQDVAAQLRLLDHVELVGVFDRPNLTYRILPRTGAADQVTEVLARHAGQAAIIYCQSRKQTEELSTTLGARGITAKAYHAGMSPDARTRVQDDFINERLNVVTATVAFGMGIDRGDVRCVIHAAMPKSVEHYQQETGRAGRDGLPSECVLLYSSGDVMGWKRLMERSAGEVEGGMDPEEMQAQLDLLERMHRVCTTGRCRHRVLTEYFGQTYQPPGGHVVGCGACDVCLKELAAVPESQRIAQIILSNVARLKQASPGHITGYGNKHLVDVMRGANVAAVMERGHDRVSTFGLLKSVPKQRLTSYIDQLIDLGYLARTPGEYPVVVLTAAAGKVLRNEGEVTLVDPPATVHAATGAAAASEELDAGAAGLFEALRGLRRAVATEMGVPPYIVFGDVTLKELARVRPGSLVAMQSIRGVEPAKIKQFGERVIEFVSEYCSTNGLDLNAATSSGPARQAARSSAPKASGMSPARMQTAIDEMFSRGASVEEVAAAIGRAVSTCHGYLTQWIVRTRPNDIDAWVSDDLYEQVVAAAAVVGVYPLTPIHTHLQGAVDYDIIRLVGVHQGWFEPK